MRILPFRKNDKVTRILSMFCLSSLFFTMVLCGNLGTALAERLQRDDGGCTGPKISGTPATTCVEVGSSYSFIPTGRDECNTGSLSYSIQNQPSWADFNASLGFLNGTPDSQAVGTYADIVITVTDGNQLSASLPAFTLTVIEPCSNVPTISGTPDASAEVGSFYQFTPIGADVCQTGSLSYSIQNRPSWADFETDTGTLYGTPTSETVGTYSDIIITILDGRQASADLAAFTIEVNEPCDGWPRIIGTPDTNVEAGSLYSFFSIGTDACNTGSLTYSIQNQPSWAEFDAASSELKGIPGANDVGTHAGIVISVTDDNQASAALPAFDLVVSMPTCSNRPIINGMPEQFIETGSAYSFIPVGINACQTGSLVYSIQNKPDWASFDTATGALTGIATPEGSYADIIISVTDGNNVPASLSAFTIEVGDGVCSGPSISGTPATEVVLQAQYAFTPTGIDRCNTGSLTYSIENQPALYAVEFDTSTGTLSGYATDPAGTVYSNIIISVTDGNLKVADLSAFNIVVVACLGPTISGTPPETVEVGRPYEFTPTGTDVCTTGTLTYSIQNKPSWASFDPATGTLTGTPEDSDEGLYSDIVIRVTDGDIKSADLEAFSIDVVRECNAGPSIFGTPPTVAVIGGAYSFIPVGADVCSTGSLDYSIENKPSWATLNETTGELSGTATPVGIYPNIIITVTDGDGLYAGLDPFQIEVISSCGGPTISGSPITTITLDGEYSFLPSGTDACGSGSLRYAIQNKPVWAGFSESTGGLSGTAAPEGLYQNILITVTDGNNDSADLPAFDIEVTSACVGPAIQGTPLDSLEAGVPYRFLPIGADVCQTGSLSYSIQNKPSWASFNTLSGELSGTPTITDVGTFADIVITVTDGNAASAGLSDFAIEVTEPVCSGHPLISGTPASSVVIGEAYSFAPLGTDACQTGSLTYSIQNQPSWANFDSATGILSGTPQEGDLAVYSDIVITVTDGNDATASLMPFTIHVVSVSDPSFLLWTR